MSLSDEGILLARALLERAEELGIDLGKASPKQMTPLFDLIPSPLMDKILEQAPEGGDTCYVVAVFIHLLVSQLPERLPQVAKMPSWARAKVN